MVERQAFKRDLAGVEAGDEIVEHHGARQAVQRRRGAHIGHDHRPRHRRHPVQDLGQLAQAVVAFAVVIIAVGGEQDLGFDLAEAVDDPLDAEVRRARGPDGADGTGGEHGGHGFGHIRQIGGDPVAGLDARRRQGLGQARHLVM